MSIIQSNKQKVMSNYFYLDLIDGSKLVITTLDVGQTRSLGRLDPPYTQGLTAIIILVIPNIYRVLKMVINN